MGKRCEVMDLIKVAQDRFQCQAYVRTIMNLKVAVFCVVAMIRPDDGGSKNF
jgi:hypothetical protein